MGLTISKADQAKVNEFVDHSRRGALSSMHMDQLNGKDESGDTALHAACMNSHIDVVQAILSQGSALERDSRDFDNATPLMIASGQGCFEIVHKLVRAGSDALAVDRLGWAPVHHAAAGGHALVVSFLVERAGRAGRKNAFDRDSSGCSPLWLAVDSGDLETVRVLLLEGADPDEINDEDVSVFDKAKDVEGESEDVEEDGPIMEMLKTAAFQWSEARRDLGIPEFLSKLDQGITATVLEGTKESPSFPVADEYDRIVNEDLADEANEDGLMRRIRYRVAQALKAEEPFIESHLQEVVLTT